MTLSLSAVLRRVFTIRKMLCLVCIYALLTLKYWLISQNKEEHKAVKANISKLGNSVIIPISTAVVIFYVSLALE